MFENRLIYGPLSVWSILGFVFACSPSDSDSAERMAPLSPIGERHEDFTTTVDEWHGRPGENNAAEPEFDRDNLRNLPLVALCASVGGDCGREFRSGRHGEAGEEFVSWRIYTSVPPSTEAATTEGPEERELGPPIDIPNPLAGGVVDSAGNQFLYLRFSPIIDPDAVSRVNWNEPANRTNVRAALRAGERERQMEIESAALMSRRRVEAETTCRWANRALAAHAAYVWCPPGVNLTELDFVVEVSPVRPLESAARGDYMRSASGLQHGHLLVEEYDGRHGANELWSQKVTVAVLDQDGFNKPQFHPAYNRTAHLASNSRISSRTTCTDTSCSSTVGTVTGYEGVHGELAIGAFSIILDGQDPNITTLAGMDDRSYGAWDTLLALVKVNGNSASYATAISQQSVTADIIVANAIALGVCGRPTLMADVRDAWNLAYSSGVVGVVSAGNWVNRTNDDCTVNGLATRTDIVVVGAYGDDLPSSQSTWLPNRPPTPIGSWLLDTQPLMGWHSTDLSFVDNCPNTPVGQAQCWSSALGGAPMRINGSTPFVQFGAWKGIDIVAPSGRELSPRFVGGVTSYGTACCGTSYAAPEVASVMASVRDWTYTGISAWQYPDMIEAGTLHVLMLLMGDGARGSHSPGAGTSLIYTGKDKQWGAGRLKARVFTDRGLDSPWGFGWDAKIVSSVAKYSVSIASVPLDADVDLVKVAMSYHEPNLDPFSANESAYIKLRLLTQTACTGNWIEVSVDDSPDPEKIISVPGTMVAGKCVRAEADVITLPPPASRQVFMAFYYEDRDRESTENLNAIE